MNYFIPFKTLYNLKVEYFYVIQYDKMLYSNYQYKFIKKIIICPIQKYNNKENILIK